MAEYTRKIVYLSQEQYETLVENRTITVDGKTVVYDANDIYITPQATPLYPVAGATNGNFAALDSNGELVDSGHKHGDYAAKQDTVLDTTLSMGRLEGSTVGEHSVALGNNVVASGNSSITLGDAASSIGNGSSSIGLGTFASGRGSIALGYMTVAKGIGAFSSGYGYYTTTRLTGNANATTYTYSNFTFDSSYIGWYLYCNLIFGKITAIDTTNSTITVDQTFKNQLSNTYAGIVAPGAQGNYSHVEGLMTTASGTGGHAEGYKTIASGNYTHAEGAETTTSGDYSHAEGRYTIANGRGSHVEGSYNIADSYASWPEWVANTSYVIGDKVKVTDGSTVTGYICKTANSDSSFTAANWTKDNAYNYLHIAGNGTANNARSNAYALDWDGNGHFMGDVYVGANADSSGGTKLARLSDVQIAGTSIISSGVANIPIANSSNPGVGKVDGNYGITIVDSNKFAIYPASLSAIKSGSGPYLPISAIRQHAAVFYGLSKVAGVDLANETVTLGTYPETSKAAIRSLIGAENGDDIVKVQDTQPTTPATKIWMPETPPTSVQVPTVGEMESALAEKVDDVQVNGTSVVNNGVANIPIATSSDWGVVKVYDQCGIRMTAAGIIETVQASASIIKTGTNQNQVITPAKQHESTFYGLAKAAGDTTQSSSSNAVGTYTDNAKAAIKAMLGVVDGVQTITVSGTTPSITAISNARYICGEVSTLDITPPATGICDIVFESGSTPTVLTVPNTVKFPSWFDATALEADTTYEINIVDGVYGAVMTWE